MKCSARQRASLEKVDCEIAFDNLTRQLYATDASIYQIEPAAVAFPRNAQQASAVIRAAADENLPLIPRGAGSGLAGGAIGDGLVVEFARFNREISGLDLERRTVRVGAGVVLDQLNEFLKPAGFCFGPDVATSSRATLGGMIANNASGAHVPVYGCTADHVHSLEVVLADGRIQTMGTGGNSGLEKLVAEAAGEIRERMPADLLKRWPGYGVDRFLRQPNASHLLAGSEGTLAAILSAELKIVPLPRRKSMGLIFFASVAEAMRATVELLHLKPAAIEHVDRVLFEQTRGQLNFKAARDLLELDAKPCEAVLLVEFFDDAGDRLAALGGKWLGLRTLLLQDPASMNLVWDMRKAGLSLLTGCKGDAKPVAAIEDAAVRPRQLPEYVAALSSILERRQLKACFYGHAAAGLLHVRPVLDLHDAGDLKKFRQVADDVAALVRSFKGSLAAEHGVGIARTEYMPEQLGPTLLGLMREIKNVFDPRGLFNPGKLLPDGRFKIDANLRLGAGYKLALPFAPVLAFAARDGSFTANLEQCNGCGGCRKETPTMCPTFMATGEEFMSTRGRANAIRAALEGRGAATRCAARKWKWRWAIAWLAKPARRNVLPMWTWPCSRPNCSTPGTGGTAFPGANDFSVPWTCWANWAAWPRAWPTGSCNPARCGDWRKIFLTSRRNAPSRPMPRNDSITGSRGGRPLPAAGADGFFCGTTPLRVIMSRASRRRRWRCWKRPDFPRRWSPAANVAGGPPSARAASTRRPHWAGATWNC